MYYVYLIESLSAHGQRYVGLTDDLKQRLQEHNEGKSSYTSKSTPWKLTTYIAFTNRQKAEAFERYLKSGSCICPQAPLVTLELALLLVNVFRSLAAPAAA